MGTTCLRDSRPLQPARPTFPNTSNGRCRRRVSHVRREVSNRHGVEPESRISDQATLRASRRNVVIALPAAYTLQAAMRSHATEQVKQFDHNGIVFEYPSSWLKAYDRTNSASVGGLVLVGDFQSVDTISVVSSQLSDELQGLEGGTLDPKEAAQTILKDPLTSVSLLNSAAMHSTIASQHPNPHDRSAPSMVPPLPGDLTYSPPEAHTSHEYQYHCTPLVPILTCRRRQAQ